MHRNDIYDYFFKIILFSDERLRSARGKLISEFTGNELPSNLASYDVKSIKLKSGEDEVITRLQIWNPDPQAVICGQFEYNDRPTANLRGASACVFIYDMANPDPEFAKLHMKIFNEWYGDNRPVICVVGIKSSAPAQNDSELQEIARVNEALFINNVSSTNSINELFHKLAQKVLKKHGVDATIPYKPVLFQPKIDNRDSTANSGCKLM